MKKIALCSFLLFLLGVLHAQAQQDTAFNRPNTIKINLISSALYDRSLVLSYERITKPNQSFGVMAGFVRFPDLRSLTNIAVVDEHQRNGIVVGGEYRFYLKKENKFNAPHGVYIGPYANFYQFKNERSLRIDSEDGMSTSEADFTSDINVLNIGAQLGYQFVINNRWTIDMIFAGPSVSRYSAKLSLDGNFDLPEDEVEDEIIDALFDRFPLLEEIVSEGSVNLHGKNSTWSGGFRYQLNVGYHFGRKKNK